MSPGPSPIQIAYPLVYDELRQELGCNASGQVATPWSAGPVRPQPRNRVGGDGESPGASNTPSRRSCESARQFELPEHHPSQLHRPTARQAPVGGLGKGGSQSGAPGGLSVGYWPGGVAGTTPKPDSSLSTSTGWGWQFCRRQTPTLDPVAGQEVGVVCQGLLQKVKTGSGTPSALSLAKSDAQGVSGPESRIRRMTSSGDALDLLR
jgi:hypothetical protein